MRSGFWDKLAERLDKLDPQSLQGHFLRLAQERGLLETIFQSIQEGVIVINEAGGMNYANHAAEQLMGFSYEEMKGKHISRIMREIDWERILGMDAREWAKLVSHEVEITYPDHRFVTFYVVPLMSKMRKEGGAVIILRDVTYDREHESRLLESERVNAVKLLAAGVAHEIGNPLNALNIHLQLLARAVNGLAEEENEAEPEKVSELRELVEIARNEVSRLDVIITQFLRAIRPSKPKLALHDIGAVLRETLTVMKNDIQNRSIEVEMEMPEMIPNVKMDRDQIKQAFFNIIKNALQAMPDGGKLTIVISVEREFICVKFADTGGGIKPETFGHIFEPYRTTKSEGSGLGLMVVQRIIQDHGGQIKVESEEGVGTGFEIYLPLAERRMRLLARVGASGDKRQRSFKFAETE